MTPIEGSNTNYGFFFSKFGFTNLIKFADSLSDHKRTQTNFLTRKFGKGFDKYSVCSANIGTQFMTHLINRSS